MMVSCATRRQLNAARRARSLSIILANQLSVAILSRTEQILALLCPNAHIPHTLKRMGLRAAGRAKVCQPGRMFRNQKRKPLCLGRHRGSFLLYGSLAYERINFFRIPAITANKADPNS